MIATGSYKQATNRPNLEVAVKLHWRSEPWSSTGGTTELHWILQWSENNLHWILQWRINSPLELHWRFKEISILH
jgi:hypothetical protein